jgi:hypothetical protein
MLKKFLKRKDLFFIIILICSIFVFFGCAAVPKKPFMINENTYKDDIVDLYSLKSEYQINRTYSLDNNLSAVINAKVQIPQTIVNRSITVEPIYLDAEKVLPICMGTEFSNIQKTKTKEGFQTGLRFDYRDQLFAFNNDDSRFLYLSSPSIEINNSESTEDIYADGKIPNFPISQEEVLKIARDYLEKLGFLDGINKQPFKVLAFKPINSSADHYQITFEKIYNGVPVSTEEYDSSLSTQNLPISGEYITVYVDANGVEAFEGILKQKISAEQSLKVVSLDSILNNMDRYISLFPFGVGNELKIDDLELKYVPISVTSNVDQYQYVLTWCFNGFEGEDIPYAIEINAINGMVIY